MPWQVPLSLLQYVRLRLDIHLSIQLYKLRLLLIAFSKLPLIFGRTSYTFALERHSNVSFQRRQDSDTRVITQPRNTLYAIKCSAKHYIGSLAMAL